MLELPTHKRILIEAQDLVQRHGFFGLSLQDLADRIHIRKPSLYAHYDSKEKLGVALVQDYRKQFLAWTGEVAKLPQVEQFQAFLHVFEDYLASGKVCPHSALSLDGPHLPPTIREASLEFYGAQVKWLSDLIESGKVTGAFSNSQESNLLAARILQQMVGAQLLARMTGTRVVFDQARIELTQSLVRAQ